MRRPIATSTEASPPLPDDAPPPALRGQGGEAIARGIAAFVSLFALLNLAIEYRQPRYDANLWWISFRPLPGAVHWVVLAAASLLFLGYVIAPEMPRWRRRATRVAIELLGVMVAWNIFRFYLAVGRGTLHAGFPVPFSLFVAAALGWMWWMAGDDRLPARGLKPILLIATTVIACMVVFSILQMFCFGKTAYRPKAAPTPADMAVVFGARVYADGRPSDALKDRVDKAVELYRAKVISRLYLSGGSAEGEPDEADAMQKLALAGGVRPEDILLDHSGLNTEDTVRNALLYLESHVPDHPPVIVAVSHFYHLPRIKMCFAANGADVYTVPVDAPLNATPKYMLREVPALWLYYLQALFQ